MLTIINDTKNTGAGVAAVVTCPDTHPNVIGGGHSGIVGNNQLVTASFPTNAALDTWTVTLADADTAWNAYAVCSK